MNIWNRKASNHRNTKGLLNRKRISLDKISSLKIAILHTTRNKEKINLQKKSLDLNSIMRSNSNPRKTIKSFSITDKMIFKKSSCILIIIEKENKIIKMIIRGKDNRIINKIINPNTEIIDLVRIRIEIIRGRISIRKRIEIYLIIIGIQ